LASHGEGYFYRLALHISPPLYGLSFLFVEAVMVIVFVFLMLLVFIGALHGIESFSGLTMYDQ